MSLENPALRCRKGLDFLHRKGFTLVALLTSLFTFYSAVESSAQNCYDPIYLSSQSDIDNFPNNYPGCTYWAASMTISGADITDLTPLNGLDSVDFLEIIDNPLLTDLYGLNNLIRVTHLTISTNPAIINCDGLTALTRVSGALTFDSNIALINLIGLEALQSTSYLNVLNNSALMDFTGLSSLNSVYDFTVSNCNALVNFVGLSSLHYITNSLSITYNNALVNLMGLSAITELALLEIQHNSSLINFAGLSCPLQMNLNITNNPALTSFIGLENLTWSSSFSVMNCGSLVNFEGLANISYVHNFFVVENSMLINFLGLSSLDSVFFFHIVLNESLIDFAGLSDLTSLGLQVATNNALVSFLGMDKVKRFRFLVIDYNLSLRSVVFDSLEYVSEYIAVTHNTVLDSFFVPFPVMVQGGVTITYNQVLNHCCGIPSMEVGGAIVIHSNETGCNNFDEIEEICDDDGDGVPQPVDNCDYLYNPEQLDQDMDGIGSICDNCPWIANQNQVDYNQNYIGDACEIPEPGKIGFNEQVPKSGLHVKGSDIYVDDTQRGLILKDYLGNCHRIYIDENGQLATIPITCPQ